MYFHYDYLGTWTKNSPWSQSQSVSHRAIVPLLEIWNVFEERNMIALRLRVACFPKVMLFQRCCCYVIQVEQKS